MFIEGISKATSDANISTISNNIVYRKGNLIVRIYVMFNVLWNSAWSERRAHKALWPLAAGHNITIICLFHKFIMHFNVELYWFLHK